VKRQPTQNYRRHDAWERRINAIDGDAQNQKHCSNYVVAHQMSAADDVIEAIAWLSSTGNRV